MQDPEIRDPGMQEPFQELARREWQFGTSGVAWSGGEWGGVEWSGGKGEEGDGRPYVHTGCSAWTNAISRWASDSIPQ
jgi:hypothetical protein